LAAHLGCTVKSVQRWESGNAKPTRVFQQALDKLDGRGRQSAVAAL
jgi:DNA-binding transcriptional regulator YiaG